MRLGKDVRIDVNSKRILSKSYACGDHERDKTIILRNTVDKQARSPKKKMLKTKNVSVSYGCQITDAYEKTLKMLECGSQHRNAS